MGHLPHAAETIKFPFINYKCVGPSGLVKDLWLTGWDKGPLKYGPQSLSQERAFYYKNNKKRWLDLVGGR